MKRITILILVSLIILLKGILQPAIGSSIVRTPLENNNVVSGKIKPLPVNGLTNKGNFKNALLTVPEEGFPPVFRKDNFILNTNASATLISDPIAAIQVTQPDAVETGQYHGTIERFHWILVPVGSTAGWNVTPFSSEWLDQRNNSNPAIIDNHFLLSPGDPRLPTAFAASQGAQWINPLGSTATTPLTANLIEYVSASYSTPSIQLTLNPEDFDWNGNINQLSGLGSDHAPVYIPDLLRVSGATITGTSGSVIGDYFYPSTNPNGGTYTISATKSYDNGTFQITKTITVCPSGFGPPTINGGTSICSGGSIVLTATTTGAPSYQWYQNGAILSGQVGNTLTVTQPGGYSATATAICGTTSASQTFTVTSGSAPSAPSISANGSTALCNGFAVTLTATGSNITWSNGATGNSISVSAAGTYTATDANGCGVSTASNAITVTTGSTPGAPFISASGSIALCNGSAVTLTATGSNITWSNGATGNSISVSAAGTYTATDASGCGVSPASNAIVVTSGSTPGAPTISASGSTALCNGSFVTLTATGSNITWNTGQTGNSISVSAAGTYTATDASSCGVSAASNAILVTAGITPGAPSISASGSTALCNGSAVTLTATGSNITWNTGQTGNSIVVATPGDYKAFDANTCGLSPYSNIITVTSGITPGAPTISASGSTALCNGSAVTLTATGSNITWNTGQTGNSITVATAGDYKAFDSNTCGLSPYSNIITVTSGITPGAPIISASGSTFLCDGASVTLTATGSNIVWNTGQTGNSIAVATAGTYTAIDQGTCGSSPTSNAIVISTGSSPATPSIGGTTTFCQGGSTTLFASGAGATKYDWYFNGPAGSGQYVGTTDALNVTQPGSYYAYSGNDCGYNMSPGVTTVTMNTIPGAPTISASGSTALCNGSTVTLTATGSNITWSNGATGNSISVSAAGTYTATDASSCGISPASNAIVVTTGSTPGAPTISASGSTALCNGSTVTLTATGSNITWSNGATGNSISVSAAGTYTATDASSCGISPASNAIVVTTGSTPGAPTISASGSTALCNGSAVTLTATGSNITWSNGATGNSISVSAAGTYTATDASSCGISPASNAIVVTTGSTPGAPTISASGSTALCNGSAVTLTATGSNITWSNGATGNSISVSAAGTYSATDASSCGVSPASNAIVVTTGSTPGACTLSPPSSNSFCAGALYGLVVNSPGATSYQWYKDGVAISGANASEYDASVAGSYSAVGINSCGNGSPSVPFTLTITPHVGTPTITGPADICSGTPITLTANVSGATGYAWEQNTSNGNMQVGTNSPTLTVTTPGSYKVSAMGTCGTSPFSDDFVVTDRTPIAPVLTSPSLTIVGQQPIIITATGGGTFIWEKDGVIISGQTGNILSATQPGTYTATVTNSFGCQSPISNSIVLTAFNDGIPPVITPTDPTDPTNTGGTDSNGNSTIEFCEGKTITLTSVAANSYLWSTGASTQAIQITSGGTYSVTINVNGTLYTMKIIATMDPKGQQPTIIITP